LDFVKSLNIKVVEDTMIFL